uniref:Uncharacterized protein n=1 Tax=Arundo donax TaxID=35708 RepID=A0A0A8YIR1_ARUDO
MLVPNDPIRRSQLATTH